MEVEEFPISILIGEAIGLFPPPSLLGVSRFLDPCLPRRDQISLNQLGCLVPPRAGPELLPCWLASEPVAQQVGEVRPERQNVGPSVLGIAGPHCRLRLWPFEVERLGQ